jgi:hypothetical protein
MKPRSKALAFAAVATLALLLVNGVTAYVLDEFGLADRLFAGDASSALTALLLLAVVSSRVLLAMLMPGVITVAAIQWWWTVRARPPT